MNLVNIKFEVHYHDAIHNTISYVDNSEYDLIVNGIHSISVDRKYDARYRIYVDSNLLAERVWYWGNDHYIKENMFVQLDKNIEYTVKLEPLFCMDYLGFPIAIRMKNIKIPNATILNQSKNNLTFKIA